MARENYSQNPTFNIQMVTLDDVRKVVKDMMIEALKEFGHMGNKPRQGDRSDLLKQEWLNEREVSYISGFSVRALQTMRYRREGPRFYKEGKKVLYRPQDVLDYFENGFQPQLTIDQD